MRLPDIIIIKTNYIKAASKLYQSYIKGES